MLYKYYSFQSKNCQRMSHLGEDLHYHSCSCCLSLSFATSCKMLFLFMMNMITVLKKIVYVGFSEKQKPLIDLSLMIDQNVNISPVCNPSPARF